LRIATRIVLLSLLVALPASAVDRIVRVRPGPEGEDVATYAFFPALARGNSDTLYAYTATGDTGANHSMQTFIKFQLPAGLLGPNETIKLAELRITYAFDFDQFGNVNDEPGSLNCSVVTQAWPEATTTWNNRPAFAPPFQTLTNITGLGLLRFNITAAANGWVTGGLPNHGLALTSTTERVLGFYAFEKTGVSDDIRPYLLLVVGDSGIIDADSDGVTDASDNCPAVANALQEDTDADHVGDACDSCTLVANTDQRDTDGDGIGSICDPDFDQNGVVNASDLASLKSLFFSNDADADLNGDGVVNAVDLALLKARFFKAPGPPALAP
jgi:hypothetical protein